MNKYRDYQYLGKTLTPKMRLLLPAVVGYLLNPARADFDHVTAVSKTLRSRKTLAPNPGESATKKCRFFLL